MQRAGKRRAPPPWGIMACSNSAEWIASGESQLDAAQLSGPARTQATLSLRLSNPFQPQTSQLYVGPINRHQPYFIQGDGGCPQLVIPAAVGSPDIPQSDTTTLSKPADPPSLRPVSISYTPTIDALPGPELPVTPGIEPTSPCPPGYVSSGAPELTNDQLTNEVARQLTGGTPAGGAAGGGCTPQIVLAPQQMTTKNDFLVVHVSDNWSFLADSSSTITLTTIARVLTCDGQINTMQKDLTLTHKVDDAAAQGNVCIPLTDGYLLSVIVSGAPFCSQPGDIWVQGEVRNASCAGQVVAPLFSGYINNQGWIGWPGGRQDTFGQGRGVMRTVNARSTLNPNNSWIPQAGTQARVSQVVVNFLTSATVADRHVSLFWSGVGTGTNSVFGTTITQPASKHYQWIFANGIQPGLMLGAPDQAGGFAFDAIAQVPIPPDLVGDENTEVLIFTTNQQAGDQFLFSCVIAEYWAKPDLTGF